VSCDHKIDKNSVIAHGLMVDFYCAVCLVAGSLELSAADACWENEPESDNDRSDDDEPRRYESVPSFVEDEPIPFLPTPKANRAVRD